LYDLNTFSTIAATLGITITFFSCHLNAAVVIIVCPIDDNGLLLNFHRSHISVQESKHILFADILIEAFISAVDNPS
jgi:hypothetical protein